jgi:hypothetical protein
MDEINSRYATDSDDEEVEGGAIKQKKPVRNSIAHVKGYCAKHSCSYKDAIQKAKATYKR